MMRHLASPILAAIIAAGTGVAVLTTLPGDTMRDMQPAPATHGKDHPR